MRTILDRKCARLLEIGQTCAEIGEGWGGGGSGGSSSCGRLLLDRRQITTTRRQLRTVLHRKCANLSEIGFYILERGIARRMLNTDAVLHSLVVEGVDLTERGMQVRKDWNAGK